MRRSICHCEPSSIKAGEAKPWKFIYTTSSTLPKGTKIKFDLQSKGREIDWQIPSTNLKKGGAVIYARLSSGKVLSATEVETTESLVPQFEFTLPSAIESGDFIEIVIGPKEEGEPHCVRAQTLAQRRKPFFLYIDPTGKSQYDEPEIFHMDVRGGELSSIRILTPSFVVKNKRFDAIVRFEDAFGNLTSDADEDTLIELSHEHLRENLSWKLFVPETGFISLPNLYFNENGTYTIQLIQLIQKGKEKKVFRSAPIRCLSEGEQHLFWGVLHGESEKFDSSESIESCLRHFRDDKSYSFYGVSPFESQEETSNEAWKSISQHVSEFNEDERFTTFLGFQWQGENGSEGERLFVFAKDGKALLRKKELKSNTLQKIYKSFSPKEALAIPCFTMASGCSYNFEQFDPEFERVVEIYNAWGCSERSQKEGNLYPISSKKGHSKKEFQEALEGSIQKALKKNHRFGFVAGGLDDRGVYGELFDSDQLQYPAGMTAIIAPSHSREALFEALYQRSCYATTGERIIVGFFLAGLPMGKETSTAEKPGLVVNRHLSGYVAGTAPIATIEIVRCGETIKTITPGHYHCEFTYDDMTLLEKVALPSADKRLPFVYYYLRITQEDGHMAWSSPIWVDYIPLSQLPKTAKVKPAKPVLKKELEEDDFEEEDEEDFSDFDTDLNDS